MSSLWATNDVLAQERLNRTALPVRLLDPIYDVDDAGVVTVDAKPVDGLAMILSSYVTHYTVPGSGVAVTIVHRITICNNDSVANWAYVYAGAGGSGAQVIFSGSLAANETVVLEGPWFLAPTHGVLSYGVTAGVANVGLRCEVTELAAQPDGVTLITTDGSAMTTTNTAYYTCPGSGVQHANVVAITVCNWDGSARTVTVEIRPSGGAVHSYQYVLNGSVASGEAVIIGGFVLQPGDAIRAAISSGTSVSIRVSAVEYAS